MLSVLREAFNGLSKREQLYAHYISRASFYGGLIVLIQTSPEAPHIFRLIQRINTAQKTAELKEAATKAGVSEADFTAYLVYCCGVYANMGNYKVRSCCNGTSSTTFMYIVLDTL